MRGPGVVCPLEGNVTTAAFVVNAATARIHTRCEWTYDYTSDPNTIPMYRAAHLLAGIVPTANSLVLNEPNNSGADGDGMDAATVAALLQNVTAPICFPNVMLGLESSRRWLADYKAAGGKEPALHGAHAYSTEGNGLKALALEWRAFLGTLGWHNPLVLTECGPRPIPPGTPPAKPEDVASVLQAAFALWREGVVAGFAWFSHRYPADGGAWAAGDLLREDGSLLPLGELYRALATRPVPVTDKQIYFPAAGH